MYIVKWLGMLHHLKEKSTQWCLKILHLSISKYRYFYWAVCNPLHLWIAWISFYKQISRFNLIMTLRFALLTSGVLLPTSSILHLCLMALDRMMAVSKPIYHQQKLRRTNTALKLLANLWLLALIITLLSVQFYQKPISYAILASMIMIFPSCFITLFYSILLHRIRERNRSFPNVQNIHQID